ncbi:TIGR04222 domain-containing membrane protein [Streptomyces ficellus]|uniref:TIGR04222 domain-containing membrane protein n=1 Tax=Streptomyces ficellus TaxID=1977088 RepID=UPI001FCBC83E|nr:TIGR04222 domain-containing membrane protein [Streptomyces ficellus]
MNVLVILVYIAVVVSSALLIRGVAASRRGPGGSVHYRVEAAFLGGGPARVVDSALASLQGNGRVTVGGPGIVHVVRAVGDDPVERAVLHELSAAPSGALHVVRLAAMRNPAVQEIGDRLAARGLIVPRSAGRTWRRWSAAQAIGCFVLFPVSILVTVAEFAAADLGDTPFPFVVTVLPAVLPGLVIAMICGAVASRRLTGAGRRALAAYRRAEGHRTGPGDLVALNGLGALPDPVFQEQLVAAARMYGGRRRRGVGASTTARERDDLFSGVTVAVWCASAETGGSSCGGGCGGGGGGGSACSGGSSCGSGGGGGGSSCGGGGGSSCGGGGGGGGD